MPYSCLSQRRWSRLRLFILVSLCGWCATLTTLAADAKRPNILWISTEDISAHLGCYGDPHAKTPHLDQLAREGVRYSHAFVVAGVCAPCRSSVITGIYPTTLGTQHMRCQTTLPPDIKCFTQHLRAAGYYCTNQSKTDYQFKVPPDAWDQSGGRAHWRNRPDPDQPFFAVFNFTTTHESAIASDTKYQQMTKSLPRQLVLKPASLTTLPPYYCDTPVTRKDWARNYNLIAAMDRQAGALLKQLDDDGLADSTIVIFWSDHGIGLPRGKRWLYDSGMHVPLIVRIPEAFRVDNQGKAGMVSKELVSLIDLAPTLLNLAGIKIPEVMQGRAFLGRQLTAPRQYVYGARDRMDERYDIIRAVRDQRYKYIRNYEPFKAYYQYMNTPEKGASMRELRRVHALGKLPAAAARFMADHKPNEELYDLQEDPHEIHNLANSLTHNSILARMRQAHLQWVLDTRDLGLLPEPEIVLREQQFKSRYAILRQPEGESLVQQIRKVAGLTLKGLDAIPELLQHLNDDDATVRYWACIGLGNLGTAARQQQPAVRALLQDSSPSVSIAAARALCRMNDPAPALPILARHLKSPREWVRLNATIVLDEIDEQAR
ncbi:MAG: sulfatase-like hydrolase/transferase, partial [Pirellulaceae bacterium]|nr:sulfatase-like hydrolase/transferase [Pirellulaceae bacterium]